MRQLQVYKEVMESFLKENGLKAIGTRWVIVNKGDAKNPFIRARLVAQETKNVTTLNPEESAAITFAATPPLEALRMLMSLVQLRSCRRRSATTGTICLVSACKTSNNRSSSRVSKFMATIQES